MTDRNRDLETNQGRTSSVQPNKDTKQGATENTASRRFETENDDQQRTAAGKTGASSAEDADSEQGNYGGRSNAASGKEEGLGEAEQRETLRKDSKEMQKGNKGNADQHNRETNTRSSL